MLAHRSSAIVLGPPFCLQVTIFLTDSSNTDGYACLRQLTLW